MGRRQVADRDALLDAAESVVRCRGAARLTLDAVACTAGVSKASVLYECKSKRGLIQAMIERRLAADRTKIMAWRSAMAEPANAAIRAQVAAASDPVTAEDRSFMLSLMVVLAEDPDLLDPIRTAIAGWMAEIRENSPTPHGAMLAFLALEGLQSFERFDVHRFGADDRRRLLDEIAWLAGQTPAPAAAAPLAR